MIKKKILLLGAGGHAKSCIEVIENNIDDIFFISGIIDKIKNNKIINDKYKIIGNDNDLKFLKKKNDYAFVAFGHIKKFKLREKMFKNLLSLGYKLPTIISKNAIVSKNTVIGKGTIVMHGVIINSNVNIGDNCIINTHSTIEHDVSIGNNCHIAPGAILNGGAEVEDNCFIGSGSVIKENIKILKNSIIGANIFIKKNTRVNELIKK
jgi:sugar O-acyltransferase (sialic acid O-acetyltransferase NeuD family)